MSVCRCHLLTLLSMLVLANWLIAKSLIYKILTTFSKSLGTRYYWQILVITRSDTQVHATICYQYALTRYYSPLIQQQFMTHHLCTGNFGTFSFIHCTLVLILFVTSHCHSKLLLPLATYVTSCYLR